MDNNTITTYLNSTDKRIELLLEMLDNVEGMVNIVNEKTKVQQAMIADLKARITELEKEVGKNE